MTAPLGAPPHGHGGGGHPGHGGGGFRPGPFRRGGSWGGGWGAGPYYEPVYAAATTETCASWGSPVAMPPELSQIGSRLLQSSAGQPASGYYAGVLYLFSVDQGVMTARPCAAKSSTLSGAESYAGYPIAGVADELPTFSIPQAAIALFFYTATAIGQWVPASGQWTMAAAAMPELASILASHPGAPVGAYVWDGQTMSWLSAPMSTLRST